MPQVSLDRLIAEKEPAVISEELTRAGIQASSALASVLPAATSFGCLACSVHGRRCVPRTKLARPRACTATAGSGHRRRCGRHKEAHHTVLQGGGSVPVLPKHCKVGLQSRRGGGGRPRGGAGGRPQSRLFGGMSGRCIACAAAWRLQCKHARGGGRRWLTGAAPLAAALRCWRWRASGRGRHDERPPAPAAASPRAAAACLLHRLCPAAGLHHPFWRLPGPGG